MHVLQDACYFQHMLQCYAGTLTYKQAVNRKMFPPTVSNKKSQQKALLHSRSQIFLSTAM